MNSFFKTYLEKDPAAKSVWEVALLYPGPRAIGMHRVAHFLYSRKVPFLPRLISEISRFLSGIEIHPGAEIGRNLFIDHGMGVIIGETTIIDDDVMLFQGVTLGGRVNKTSSDHRHPHIKSGVLVGAGAKVLGAVTVGENTKIGANAVVTKDVKANAIFAGVPVTEIKK